MPIRCKQCGANNHAGNVLCLTCGADLTESREPVNESALFSEPEPIQEFHPAAEPESTAAVDESSHVTTAIESNLLADDVRVLFQAESQLESSSPQFGRYLLLILLGVAAATAGWHWRDIRNIATRLITPSTARPAAANSALPSPTLPAPTAPQSDTTQSVPHSSTPVDNASAPGPSTAESTPASPQNSQPESTDPSQPRIRRASRVTRLKESQETEGEKYLYGDGVPVDCDRAQKDLLAAARHSNPKAESALGSMYATGHCAIRDLPLAYRWFNRAQKRNRRPDPKIAKDMKLLWNQMSPEEQSLATR